MKLFTAEQMRRLDETAIKEIGIPGVVLMENAARGMFNVIVERTGPVEGMRALILCGKGNNGGDGFAIARYLSNAGAIPHVVLAADPSDVKGDAKTNMNVCLKMNIPLEAVEDSKKIAAIMRKFAGADLVIDALLGTGVKGAVSPFYANIIKKINSMECPVFSVDVPSGVNVDDGRVYGEAVRADCTVTFGGPKIGLYVYPGAFFAGAIYVVDIGVPVKYMNEAESNVSVTTRSYVRDAIKERPRNAHKGICGKLLVVGGSPGMSGSVCLTGRAAMRTGAGLVYLAVPRNILNAVEKTFIEGVSIPLPADSNGRLKTAAIDALLEKIAGVDAVVVGPGMGFTADTAAIVEQLIKNSGKPLLIDADGLSCMAMNPDMLNDASGPVIITPHAGEMARLTGGTPKGVEAARLSTAGEFAERFGVTVILKGANSIITSPAGFSYVNPTGNEGMATAGSGDVLSGIAGALFAEGMPPLDAARCGAYIHGSAGDLAAAEKSTRSVMASDILNCVPDAISDIKSDLELSCLTQEENLDVFKNLFV